MLKRFLIPPLIPVVLVALISIWVVFDETQSLPRMIDGRPDNAPRNAAAILLLLTPMFYLLFGILNSIDAAFDRFGDLRAWAVSTGICTLLSVWFIRGFYLPALDSSPVPGVGFGILTGFLSLFPMSLLRRLRFNADGQ
jgi:hypothetical protein